MRKRKQSAAVPVQGATTVTLAELACAAGVSAMTVSRALRNAPGSSAATRAKIQHLAERMGYVPNPLVSAYQAHVRRRRAAGMGATLGWLNDHAEPDYWRKHPFARGRWRGAAERAAELGYRLEEIWNEGVTGACLEDDARRLHRQIVARGIPGLLIPHGRLAPLAGTSWPGVAVITGVGDPASPVHRRIPSGHHAVLPDYSAHVRLAFEQLASQGCERIGFHLPGYLDHLTDHAMRAAFLSCQSFVPRARRVPLLTADIEIGGRPEPFHAWYRRHRPDGMLCSKSETVGWLEAIGARVPGTVQVAHLWLADDVKDWAGVDPGQERIGATMVDWLVALVQRNDRDEPRHPLRILVPGEWREGATARRLPADHRSATAATPKAEFSNEGNGGFRSKAERRR